MGSAKPKEMSTGSASAEAAETFGKNTSAGGLSPKGCSRLVSSCPGRRWPKLARSGERRVRIRAACHVSATRDASNPFEKVHGA